MTLLGTKFASEIDQKSIQKGFEAKMQDGLGSGPVLELFLVDFGAKLGASWTQVGTRISRAKMGQHAASSQQAAAIGSKQPVANSSSEQQPVATFESREHSHRATRARWRIHVMSVEMYVYETNK